MLAMKCVQQSYTPNDEVLKLLETFRFMVNHTIRIGLKNNTSVMKRLGSLSYQELKKFEPIYAYYRCNAISKAAGILANRKQTIKRGLRVKNPYMQKDGLVLSAGFKINNGILIMPIIAHKYFEIPLNDHVKRVLSDPALKVRSFTLTASTLSISFRKEVEEIPCTKTVGIDRNLRNVTCGNDEKMTVYKCAKMIQMKENYRYIKATFRRNDHRIIKQIAAKLGERQTHRVRQIINRISKDIVENAAREKTAIAFENLKGIRKLYRKGNGQGTKYRGKLNGWPFYELQRQVEYKARWVGIPVILVDPKRTSQLCPKCGKKLQSDRQRRRDLWCSSCERWQDRDIVAAMNIAHKGLVRFANPKGDAVEAQSGTFDPAMTESESISMVDPVIRIVDASKSIPKVSL